MRMRIQINMKYFSAIYKKNGMFKAWQQNNELKFFKYMQINKKKYVKLYIFM